MSQRKTLAPGRPAVPGRYGEKSSGLNDAARATPAANSRRRSNSQSQVVSVPSFLGQEAFSGSETRSNLGANKNKAPGGNLRPQKRHQAEFYVTLVSLNDTFPTKHVHVPYHPETCKLGRPTGTKVKPHVSNGYFDSRVLSRNHACMYVSPKTGQVMVQDMGSSNGTFVNSEKLAGEPVAIAVGDTINLGFNIQVETSHKQISARVESINVVSNNPQGAVSDLFPRLTKSALADFSDADMHHYEFIQGSCAQLAGGKGGSSDETELDPKRQSARAFDRGMFSDIVPSLDEMFETSANQQMEDVGIYANSGLETSPELVSTLDYLGANLAKVKHQNTILASLESFFKNYTARVDEINSTHVQEQVRKFEAEHKTKLQQERDKASHVIQDQEQKLTAQARLVSTLETEIAQLRSAQFAATKALDSKKDAAGSAAENENEFEFTQNCEKLKLGSQNHTELRGKQDKLPAEKLDLHDVVNSKPLDAVPAASQEETTPAEAHTQDARAQSIISEFDSRSAESEKQLLDATNLDTATPSIPRRYIEQIQHVLSPYKNHGVMAGVLVVIAGFVYQHTRSS
ncbi:hypothetical protein OY671_006037 [Metschnikowia pulcherrima]|nr:hypothetical protein OY671_006037 [Metschnikowia pulcherrima]